jgi:outer membrane biosynthesis protein TonB
MKVNQVIGTALLFLLPAAIVPAYAQAQHEGEKEPAQKQQQPARPAQPQAKPAQQQAKPTPQPQHAQAPQQARPAQQPTKPTTQPQRAQSQPQAKPTPQPQRAQVQQQAKPAQQRNEPAQPPQRAQVQQRASPAQPTAGHGRIPDDRFRASFGSGHTFHVNRAEFAGASRRFQYGGFWFAMVNPWPVAWLYTDAVYVDYFNGGYFLCDPVHPGVYLSINVG